MADSGLPTPTTSFSHSHVEEDGPSDMARGLMMVGVVILFLFSLVAVRLMCNVFIDIAILGDAPSLMKILSEIRQMICPCWHPRTEPQQDNNNNNRRRDSGRIDRTATAGASRSVLPVETEIVNMHSLLAGLSPEEKQELLASILNSKEVTDDDVLAWKSYADQVVSKLTIPDGGIPSDPTLQKEYSYCSKCSDNGSEDGGSSRSVSSCTTQEKQQHHDQQDHWLCPICIHEIQTGDRVCTSGYCPHIFHRDCLAAWLSTSSRLCPYCRQEILSQDMIDEAHRIKEAWRRERSADEDCRDDDSSSSADSR